MTGVLILSANEFFAMRILRCLATLKIRTCVMGYEEIKCVAPVTLMFESIRNMSLKDINRHNLYFLRKMIRDPLFYCYFIPIVCYKFMVPILKSIQKYILNINNVKLPNL